MLDEVAALAIALRHVATDVDVTAGPVTMSPGYLRPRLHGVATNTIEGRIEHPTVRRRRVKLEPMGINVIGRCYEAHIAPRVVVEDTPIPREVAEIAESALNRGMRWLAACDPSDCTVPNGSVIDVALKTDEERSACDWAEVQPLHHEVGAL